MRKHRHQLDASVETPRPHDFTVHGIATRQLATPCPSHPASNVRDDRDTPLLSGAGRAELLKVICPTAQAEFWAAPANASPRKRKLDRRWSMSASGHNVRWRPSSNHEKSVAAVAPELLDETKFPI